MISLVVQIFLYRVDKRHRKLSQQTQDLIRYQNMLLLLLMFFSYYFGLLVINIWELRIPFALNVIDDVRFPPIAVFLRQTRCGQPCVLIVVRPTTIGLRYISLSLCLCKNLIRQLLCRLSLCELVLTPPMFIRGIGGYSRHFSVSAVLDKVLLRVLDITSALRVLQQVLKVGVTASTYHFIFIR